MNNSILRLKNILKNHSTILQNLSYISVLHLFNMLIPLLSYPYLIRVLGKETYGIIIFAQAIVGYFVILIGFGFNISATKEISINRDDKKKVSEIVSSVLIIKGILLVFSLILFFGVVSFIEEFRDYSLLFYITLYLCVNEWLFPIWYFQGIEKMKYITYLNVISRSVFLILIFVLIKSESDYLFFPIVSAIGAISASVIALFIIFKKHKIPFVFPNFQTLKFYFKESIPIFTSNLSLKLYTGSNKIIIGMFLGMQEVAYYDLGEKLLNLLRIPISVLSQVLFPKMAKLFDKQFWIKVTKIIVVVTLILTVFIELFSAEIITVFAGEDMMGAETVVKILILSATPLVLSNMLGVQILLTNGYNNQFLIVVFSSFCIYGIYISICYFLNTINLLTISFSYLLVEVYMLLHFSFLVFKLKLLHNR